MEHHGYTILARGVRFADGELDLVAAREGVLFFIEVKTRTGVDFGGIEAVSPGKKSRLMRAQTRYCMRVGLHDPRSQFDCIVVLGTPQKRRVRVLHYRNCF